MRIVILESLGISDQYLEELKTPLIQQGHSFDAYERTEDLVRLKEEAKDADVLILANMPLPEDVLSACEKLQYVDIAFTGTDHVAMHVLKSRGIPASNASGYSTEAVAELGVGMVISLLRNIGGMEQQCRAGNTRNGFNGLELRGKTVGIIGLGTIGQRSAELYHAFGCNVVANSRTIHPDAAPWIQQLSIDELLTKSDIVLLHCPLTPETRGLMNYKRLQMMKRNALLINLARGPVVNSCDLAQALREGLIAGAATDVFEREPPLDTDDPLLAAPNMLLTPHIAFATQESMELRAQIVFENLRAWLNGKPVRLV